MLIAVRSPSSSRRNAEHRAGDRPLRATALGWLRPAALGWLGASSIACLTIAQPEQDECGNGIVEPRAGEDCEPVQDPESCGAAGSGEGACRFVCAQSTCPEGYRCGLDAICRRPCLGHLGDGACSAFETLSTDVTDASIAQLTVMDVLGDSRPEILAVEGPDPTSQDAIVRVYQVDGDSIQAGAPVPVGALPSITALDAGDTLHLVAPRTPPPPPASATAPERQAVISELGSDATFREVVIQGPTVVNAGALRLASYTRPLDVPPVSPPSLLFGFQRDGIWRPASSSPTAPVPVAAGSPDDLLGPALGQPIAAPFAIAQGHRASQYCPIMVYAYRGAGEPRALDICEDAAPGWSGAPLWWPALPDGARLGEGVVLSDANGDAIDDLVVTTEDGRIHVAYAVGDGTFHSDLTTLPVQAGDGRFDGGVGLRANPGVSVGVLAVEDFNDDGRPDFVTRSTWIRSCAPEGCGTCDVPGYRCDVGPQAAPGYVATRASVVELDGDGDLELAVLARDAMDPWFARDDWKGVAPAPGDLVLIDDVGGPRWSTRVVPLTGAPELLTSGDLDGDGRDEVVLRRRADDGDRLLVVFGSGGGGGGEAATVTLDDFERIVDAHVQRERQVLAVVSEDLDGANRRLTALSADPQRRLRSATKLALDVVPRRIVPGHFDPARREELGLAIIGERPGGDAAVELVTTGGATFFDASTRRSATTPLAMDPALASSAPGIAMDLDADGVDELVVLAADGALRTLRVEATPDGPRFSAPRLDAPIEEPYRGPRWPADGAPISRPRARDLDGDMDLDLWVLTAEDPPRLAAFENRGDGTLDAAGRVLSPIPPLALSVCDDGSGDCTVRIRAFDGFTGPTERSAAVSPAAIDVLLASRRALFSWTIDPLDPAPTSVAEPVELAVVRGGRRPLSPPDGPVHVAVADIDGDGVDDVVAAGRNGIRWLNGLAVNP